jgi:cysteinyl-tRNA synthetase
VNISRSKEAGFQILRLLELQEEWKNELDYIDEHLRDVASEISSKVSKNIRRITIENEDSSNFENIKVIKIYFLYRFISSWFSTSEFTGRFSN